jgi:hypothetical protein
VVARREREACAQAALSVLGSYSADQTEIWEAVGAAAKAIRDRGER